MHGFSHTVVSSTQDLRLPNFKKEVLLLYADNSMSSTADQTHILSKVQIASLCVLFYP